MDNNNLHVRMVTPADVEELLMTHEPYVLKTTIIFKYVVSTTEEFRRRIVHTLTRFLYLTVVQSGRIVDYAYVSPFKSRTAYDWVVETSIYVDKAYRGGGVGTRLYKVPEDILKQQNVFNLEACIAYSNPESIRLREKCSCKTVTHLVECGYKAGIWYDMIWVEKMLGGRPKGPAPAIPIIPEVFKNLF